MQIYNSQHYTTLITYNNSYYYYDGLALPVPRTMTHLHTHLRQWYGSSPLPPALRAALPAVHTPYPPPQTDGWSCSMHMLLTSLSVIYQGQVLILQYGQRHVDQMPRAHIRYVITGEIAPRTDKLITNISEPLNNEDPDPYSKSYSAAGTELPEQELVKKT